MDGNKNPGSHEKGASLSPAAMQNAMMPGLPINVQQQLMLLQQYQQQFPLQQVATASPVAAVPPVASPAPAASLIKPTSAAVDCVLHEGDSKLPETPKVTNKTTKKTKTTKKKPTKKKATGASKPKAKGGGSGTHFTQDEKDLLLELVDKKKPLGQAGWKKIAIAFNKNVPEERHRKYDGLRKKFSAWCHEQIPTGEPECPDEVRKAKRIQCQIKDKAQLVVAGAIVDSDGDEYEAFYSENVTEDDGSASTNNTNNTNNADITSSATGKSKKTGYNGKGAPTTTTNESNELLAVMKANEKMRRRREKEKDKRRDKKEKRNMKLLLGLATAAVTAFAGKKAGKKAKETIDSVLESSDDDDGGDSESSMSSIDGADSPPTKRQKLTQQEKRKSKNNII